MPKMMVGLDKHPSKKNAEEADENIDSLLAQATEIFNNPDEFLVTEEVEEVA